MTRCVVVFESSVTVCIHLVVYELNCLPGVSEVGPWVLMIIEYKTVYDHPTWQALGFNCVCSCVCLRVCVCVCKHTYTYSCIVSGVWLCHTMCEHLRLCN